MTECFCLSLLSPLHHLYKRTWAPRIGQMLTTYPEDSNPEGKRSVAVQLFEQTVGHMLKEEFRVSWCFLKHGGQITFEVTERRKRSVTPGKGLEVPCQYT